MIYAPWAQLTGTFPLKAYVSHQVGSNADSDCENAATMLRAHILRRFKLEQNQEDEVWGLVNILRDVLLQKRY